MSTEIAALIVTWNRRQDVLECIDSLFGLSYPHLTVYVVDNASTDDTTSAIFDRYPAVRLIRSGKNVGFAEGNNLGLHRILQQGADAVFLVNDDVVVAPDALDELLAADFADPDVGVLCPKVVLHGEPKVVWSKGGRIERRTGIATQLGFSELDEERSDEPSEVDYAVGCAMLVKTRAMRRAGLFDPRFFMYYEETDWCRRIRDCGYRIKYVPRSRVMHKVTLNSTGRNSASYYFTRNRLLYLQCSGVKGIGIARTVAELTRSAAAHLVKGRREEGRLMLRGVLDFCLQRFGKFEGKS
jgi:hypothetical protein